MSDTAPTVRTALITGSSSGIGRATAQLLLQQGWHVRGWDVQTATIEHPHFYPQHIDLSQSPQIAAALNALPTCNAFVHAAGHMVTGHLGTLDLHASAAMWQVHVQAASQIANHLAPTLPRNSRIVLIGSRAAHGVAGRSQYAACKAALLGLAQSWALELIERGMTVNVVSPAATDTPFLQQGSRSNSAVKTPPIGRLIVAGEVAQMVAYLLSENATAITGQEIKIWGGYPA